MQDLLKLLLRRTRQFAIGICLVTLATSGLVGQQPIVEWQLKSEHLTGKTFQSSVGDAAATLRGSIEFEIDTAPNGLKFNGRDTSLLVDSAVAKRLLPQREMTIEVWAHVRQPQQWGGLLGYIQDNGGFEKGWLLGYRDNHFCFAISTTGANANDEDGDGTLTYLTAKDTFRTDRWHHVVGTYDGKTASIYVDGVLQNSTTDQSGDLVYPPKTFFEIGAYHDQNEHYRLTGHMHSVALYDRHLNGEQIKRRFQAMQTSSFPSAPVAFVPEIGPVVRLVDRERAEIAWTTASPQQTKLVYGVGPALNRQVVDATPKMQHRAILTDITDQEVRYRLSINEAEKSTTRNTAVYKFDSSFNYNLPSMPDRPSPYDDSMGAHADRILRVGGFSKGYALVLGAEEGQLAYELARRSNLKVVAVEPDAGKVRRARQLLDQAGIYGTRVSVHHGELDELPYGDYMANIVVSETLLRTGKFPGTITEAHRVVRPAGGVALVDDDDPWNVYRRPSLPGAGRWTHQYGEADNTACSKDDLVKNGVSVMWWGRPGPRPMPDRGGRNPAPLSVGGYMFSQGDRILFSQDAYNGTIYWSAFLPHMRRSNLPRDCSNIAAAADGLFVTLGGYCLVFDPLSGEILRTIPVTAGTRENEEYDWGYVGYLGSTLVGSAVVRGSAYLADDGEWYEDFQGAQIDKVASDVLFAHNRHTGKRKWQYAHQHMIMNSTITIADGTVFFVESRGVELQKLSGSRRSTEELSRAQFLIALNLETGEKKWEQPIDLSKCQYMTYLAYHNNKLVIAGTEQDKTFHHYTHDASTGERVWEQHHKTAKTHHSGHLDHLVIVGDRLYSNLHVMDLHTGEEVAERYGERRGCGTMAGSNHMMFFRHHFHGIWDLKSNRRWEYQGIRSGCWLGIIPAGGVIVAPESSSGCSCTHAIQTSIGWRPVAE